MNSISRPEVIKPLHFKKLARIAVATCGLNTTLVVFASIIVSFGMNPTPKLSSL